MSPISPDGTHQSAEPVEVGTTKARRPVHSGRSNTDRLLQFETWDQCSLKADTNLIGIVERTYGDYDTHEPLDDLLIIAHALVESSVLTRFLETGAPEKGYVFVAWADEALGRSLVAESQLNLLDRPLEIGDTVKRHSQDAIVGKVISVDEEYTLQPICWTSSGGEIMIRGNIAAQDGTKYDNDFNNDLSTKCGPLCLHSLPSGASHPAPHRLLYNIPGEELKKADDYFAGDYIIYQNWLGEVREAVTDVTLLLDDGTMVMVDDPGLLELLIVDSGKPLVALPEPDGYRKPDIVSYNRGLATVPPGHLNRGQFVVTNNKNIRLGRWITGRPGSAAAQGIIVDIRTRLLDVNWLVPYVLNMTNMTPPVSRPPMSTVRVYENLGTFRTPRELRARKDVLFYDRGRRPAASGAKSGPSVTEGQEFQAGHHVKFRDPTGAALKYRERLSKHGSFERISRDAFQGFDMNEFKIVCSRQTATVLWQDQTITKEISASLLPYSAPENPICPGEIVALKSMTEQVSQSDPTARGSMFNEIQYLQGRYALRLRKVGVVQSIDAIERLAKIRWFTDANVVLLQQGNILKAGSSLGPISDDVDEVSVYEIMTHPALVRHRREIVVVPGSLEPTPEDLKRPWPPPAVSGHAGVCALSFLRPWNLPRVLEFLLGAWLPIAKHFWPPASLEASAQSRSSAGPLLRSDDWVGEIVDLGLDGLITVRLGATTDCREIRVPLQMILMIVDSPAYGDVDDIGSVSEFVDDSDEWLSDQSAIEETVEYEGGQRLDDDSGDDMWSTDDESAGTNGNDNDVDMVDVSNTDRNESTAVLDTLPSMSPVLLSSTLSSNPSTSDPIVIPISAKIPTTAPPQFDILSTPPPNDHFHASKHTPFRPYQTRRIHKEHQILSTSLPSTIYVRSYDSRLDLLRCLIFGPEGTPYEYAPFIIDLAIPETFPMSPPLANFHSWTYGLGRINPNLYEEGKICLSLLGTWPGKSSTETWSEKSSILQILISLMGLVLVKNPFFNEAGFDTFESQGEYETEARLYTEKVFVMARGFVKHAITMGVDGMDDVLAWNYLATAAAPLKSDDPESVSNLIAGGGDQNPPQMLKTVVSRAKRLIEHANNNSSSSNGTKSMDLTDGAGESSTSAKDHEVFLPRLSQGAVTMLKRYIGALEEILLDTSSSSSSSAAQKKG